MVLTPLCWKRGQNHGSEYGLISDKVQAKQHAERALYLVAAERRNWGWRSFRSCKNAAHELASSTSMAWGGRPINSNSWQSFILITGTEHWLRVPSSGMLRETYTIHEKIQPKYNKHRDALRMTIACGWWLCLPWPTPQVASSKASSNAKCSWCATPHAVTSQTPDWPRINWTSLHMTSIGVIRENDLRKSDSNNYSHANKRSQHEVDKLVKQAKLERQTLVCGIVGDFPWLSVPASSSCFFFAHCHLSIKWPVLC